MKFLITGVAGFIGFSLSKELLKKKNTVYGIDNLDNYYSTTLKKKRIEILKKNRNFNFFKIDITNKNLLKKTIKSKKFDFVFHFAAQPGVRYSLINPKKYLDVNINGFINLLDAINFKSVRKFFYASSSSVYGDVNKFPVDEKQYLSPKNPYGISKKINEDLASIYAIKYKTQFIGLRLFTIFGEWGRPDMFIIKFIKSALNKDKFYLNNSGKHYRDFTYISDVIKIINKLLFIKKIKKRNIVLNICTSKPIYIKHLTSELQKKIGGSKIVNIKKNKADVLKTHGNNKLLQKTIGKFKFTKFDLALKDLIVWSLKNKKYLLD